jgi:hypothetical protein
VATKLGNTVASAGATEREEAEPKRWPPFAAVCVATLSSAALWWLIIRAVRQLVI